MKRLEVELDCRLALLKEDTGQHEGQVEPFPLLYLEDSATAIPIRLNNPRALLWFNYIFAL